MTTHAVHARSQTFRPPAAVVAGVGLRVDVFLYEGQSAQAPGLPDWEPFDFYYDAHASYTGVPRVAQYDPNGWTNPSTHAFSGGGTFGSGVVAARSSIVVPETGLYWQSFQWKGSAQPPGGTVDFSAHMGVNNDILDGQVGDNWSQSGGDGNAELVSGDIDFQSGPLLLSLNAGDVLFWAGHSNGETGVNQHQGMWMFGYFGPA